MLDRLGFSVHHLTKRSALIGAAVAVIAAAGGASAWALTSGSNSGYRTAAAGVGSVEQTLDSTGTLQTVNTANLAFQVAGQVAGVGVSVGQHVSVGQVLATLDNSSLTSSVDSAQSAVTSAEQKLTADESSETDPPATSAADSTTTTRAASPGQSGSSTSAVTALQTTLTSDQHKTDTESAQAATDLSAATTLCATSTGGSSSGSGSATGGGAPGSGSPTGGGTPGSGSATGGGTTGGSSTTGSPPGSWSVSSDDGTGGAGSGSGTSGSTGTSGSGGTTDTPSTPTSVTSCTSALEQVLSDQQQVSQDEQAVAQDESALQKAISASSGGTGQSGSGSGSSTSGSGPSPSVASAVAKPDQVAADEATIDADEAQLSEAQTSLDEGELVSPIAGTVASVGVTAGQTVAANSSSDQIVVIGPQSFEVSTTAAVTDLSEVHVGEKAHVTLDAQGGQLQGVVTDVGPPPASSSSTDYPVLVSLPTSSGNLFDGTSVTVSIVVGDASDVVTVPTSAVHQLGRIAYVSELRNGKPQEVSVTLGVMGDDLTQVSSGVKPGDTVVLANLSEPLPSTNSTTGRGGFAGVSSLTGTGGFRFRQVTVGGK